MSSNLCALHINMKIGEIKFYQLSENVHYLNGLKFADILMGLYSKNSAKIGLLNYLVMSSKDKFKL